jgi:hypothetical protein
MKTVTWLLLVIFGGAIAGLAQQEPVRPEEQEQVQEPDPRDVRRPSDYRVETVTDRILRGDKNRFGVSFGAYEAYSSNLFNSSTLQEGGAITALFPTIFANYARGKTRFHADYGYGYRFYNTGERPNTDNHTANISYEVPLSKRVKFSVYDHLAYGPNDMVFSFDPSAPGDFDPGYASPSEYLGAPQNILRNDGYASLGMQVSKGGSLSLAVGYQDYRYEVQSANDMNAVYASASYSHRFTSWLSISSGYSAYLTGTSSQYRNSQIQRVEVGNFEFSLSRTWKVNLAGGVDYSSGDAEYNSLTQANVRAGLTRRARNNTFRLQYGRGLSTVFGQPGLYQTDTGTLSFVQSLSRRTSILAKGNYQRGAEQYGLGHYTYYWATTSLQFGLRNDIVVSANYSYRNQKSSQLGTDFWKFGGHYIYGGLVYFWPVRHN